MLRRTLALLGAGALTVALAGCGSSTAASNSAVTVSGSVLSIWAPQPPAGSGGSVASDILDAEQLALSRLGAKAGGYTLRLRVARANEVSGEARQVVSDRTAIAYLGETVPGQSGVSVQITNELGLLQVSPTDTAVYLTQSTPAVAGAPRHFYPAHSSFHETFARVVPTSVVEARALVAQMSRRSVKSLYVGDDGSPYGRAEALEVRGDASHAGISVAGGASGAGAVFYGGTPSPAATRAVDAFATGDTQIYLPSGFYDDDWVSGLSAPAQQALTVSAPGFLSGHGDPADAEFVSAFAQAYHHAPAPQAVFGYEAMAAVIAVLRQAGSHAAARSTVVDDFRDLRGRASALGTYSLSGGDTNLGPSAFVLAGVTGGKLRPHSAG